VKSKLHWKRQGIVWGQQKGHSSAWKQVGNGGTRKGPSWCTKKYMWKEKVELNWRIQGYKEGTKHCKQVIWGQNNPGKTGKMKMVCSSNTLANF
jgi:hypothetical protein